MQMIDFEPFLADDPSPIAIHEIAQQAFAALTVSGFIYLVNHSTQDANVERIFSHSAEFFARPQTQEAALAWSSANANRGYVCMGRGRVSQGEDALKAAEARDVEGEDQRESLEIGREGHPDPECASPWPDDNEGARFRADANDFHDKCKQVHGKMMQAISIGLVATGSSVDAKWFDQHIAQNNNTLRLLHYPSVKRSVFRSKEGQVRAEAHSDHGTITLLFQDQRAGLQVHGPRGDWIDIAPIPGTIVVFAADLLMRWSKGVIRTTVYRVLEPVRDGFGNTEEDERESMCPARYLIACVCGSSLDKTID